MTNSAAIVTGASQGIGSSTAVRLARDFGSIVLVARNGTKLEETAAANATPLVIDLDLSERSSAKAVVQRVLSKFGCIDALINIAGAVPQIDLFEMTDEQWDSGLAVVRKNSVRQQQTRESTRDAGHRGSTWRGPHTLHRDDGVYEPLSVTDCGRGIGNTWTQ